MAEETKTETVTTTTLKDAKERTSLDTFFRHRSTKVGKTMVFYGPCLSMCVAALIRKALIDKAGGWSLRSLNVNDIVGKTHKNEKQIIKDAFGPEYDNLSANDKNRISEEQLERLILTILELPDGAWAIPSRPENLSHDLWSDTSTWI